MCGALHIFGSFTTFYHIFFNTYTLFKEMFNIKSVNTYYIFIDKIIIIDIQYIIGHEKKQVSL